MKIQYKFYGGTVSELEVSAEVAKLLTDLSREDDNARRKERWRNETSIDGMKEETGWEPADNTVDLEAGYIAKEEKNALLAGMAGLSKEQRRIVRLRYYEEKTESEIAKILGISQSCVSRRLETIHKALKKFLKNF